MAGPLGKDEISPTISNIAVIAGTIIGIMFGSAVTAKAQIPHINIEETCPMRASSPRTKQLTHQPAEPGPSPSVDAELTDGPKH
jgi:hypothetical protein